MIFISFEFHNFAFGLGPDSMERMYIAFYRWRLKLGTEAVFEASWKEGTLLFQKEQNALGSRLHRGEDGTYFAYAQWPSRDVYQSKKTLSQAHQEALNKMRECILESFPAILGDVVNDLLVPSPSSEPND